MGYVPMPHRIISFCRHHDMLRRRSPGPPNRIDRMQLWTGPSSSGMQDGSCLAPAWRQQLRLFYASQMIISALAVVLVHVSGEWAIVLMIHAAIGVFWMAALVLLRPNLLCTIDPYVVLSFFPWMHGSLILLHSNKHDVQFSDDLLVQAAAMILLGFMALAAGMLSAFRPARTRFRMHPSPKGLFLAGCLCLVLSAPGRAYSNSFYQIGELPAVLRYLAVFSVPAVGFLLVSTVIGPSPGRIVLLLLATGFALMATSRRALIAVALLYGFMGLFCLLMHHRGRLPRSTVGWFVICAILVCLGSVARRAQTRAHTAPGGFAGDFARNVSTLRDIYTGPNFLRALDTYPSTTPFERGKTILALAVNPVPRVLWTEKPLSMSVLMAFRRVGYSGAIDFSREEWAEIANASFSVTFLGEMWANYGWLGVMMGPFVLALIYRLLEAQLSLRRLGVVWPFYMAALVSAIVIQNRGDLVAANNYAIALVLFGSGALGFSWMAVRIFEHITHASAHE